MPSLKTKALITMPSGENLIDILSNLLAPSLVAYTVLKSACDLNILDIQCLIYYIKGSIYKKCCCLLYLV